MSGKTVLSIDELKTLALQALTGSGASPDVAEMVADILVEADLRGVGSHGLARLPNYIERMKAGLVDKHARPEIVHEKGGLVIVDGRNAFGAVAGLYAMELAAARAETHGVSWVSVRNSNHFGLASAYTQRLARLGCFGIAIANAAPAMAAYGGKRAVLGTNPISIAVPGSEPPMVLDMATTVVARGKIRQAAVRGESLQPGLALDADGNETTDPELALKGTLTPIGGPKGYGLALMIDLLSGFFSDGRFSVEVGESSDFTQSSGACFTFIAAHAGHLPAARQSERLSVFTEMIRASADDASSVLMPGEIEEGKAAAHKRDGVVLADSLIEKLKALAAG